MDAGAVPSGYRAVLGTGLVALMLFTAGAGWAQDLRNPQNFMFVADTEESLISVLDLRSEEVVYRIETEARADHVLVTPNAPLLIYSNVEDRTVSFFNLQTKSLAKVLDLPIAPRHLVMDPTGRKVAVTDSEDGGFVLLSSFGLMVDFQLEDFPPTGDVLFDPNDVDIYFSDSAAGSFGVLDTNVKRVFDIGVLDQPGDDLSPPSRSLDGRYVYVANETNGQVYGFNAFSKIIYRTFTVGSEPSRPYTTPEGLFLYLMDRGSGSLRIYDQERFDPWSEVEVRGGVDLVAVGRFDRFSVFMSSEHPRFTIFDNLAKNVVGRGEFPALPLDAQGSIDGERVYIAFRDYPQVAVLDLERRQSSYIAVTPNGAADFVLGLTNNVCH